MTKTKILVAAHKEYTFPDYPCYIPVNAGAYYHPDLPYLSDAEGDNISIKNKNFCELTVMYWAWKNLDADYYGLCHYRRYFKGKHGPASDGELSKWISKYDIVLPKQRNYLIETNYSQYAHAHNPKDLITTKELLAEKYPEMLTSWDAVMSRTHGHRFNMFIMKKNLFFNYCEWIFPLLFELENRMDISAYSDYEARVFGFIAERLLDVWMEHNNMQYYEAGVHETEHVNWLKKGTLFILRKFVPRFRNMKA
ncbi:MAG: DUF4422 domain-containing protein [Oscillospiraceae bacterium]|nr:DUF4422 domain-containing protein [Oscillospiraceae bacterium]